VSEPYLEEVFKRGGTPTYTFVEPTEYQALVVSLRTPGRGVVIEGPSGIGKTTAVSRALAQLGMTGKVLNLSARKADDRELISALPSMTGIGTVIVDDFHRLDDETRVAVADYLKVLADEERRDSKLVVVGINRAGESLIRYSPDLVNRLDTIRFEANPDERVAQLVRQGEAALDLQVGIADDIVENAHGSFYIAQMLCHECCLASNITERSDTTAHTSVSYQVVLSRVLDRLGASFMPIAVAFASGTKLRREGRAPYLWILRWLADANEWSIDLEREAALHSDLKASVGQVVEKGFLQGLLDSDENLRRVFHFDSDTRVLAVEDPQFVFFIRNLAWKKFAARVGYLRVDFESPYDLALSFAGADRALAEALAERLHRSEIAVFYDKDEQTRILAENVEDYLGPIYRSEATFVVALLSRDYPRRIWTKFESEQFKNRFGEAVIPIWFSNVDHGMFDSDREVGGLTYEVTKNVDTEADRLAAALADKVRQSRLEGEANEPPTGSHE
jgi:hypothetical protein